MAGLLVIVGLIAVSGPSVAARYSAIIVDAGSGEIVHERDADARIYPASLTKMMTLLLLFEEIEAGRLSLGTRFTASAAAARQPASRLGLDAGASVSAEEAILALVVLSANDVATVAAEALAGSEAAFAARMTERAQALGMADTLFRNASGLPDRRQVSTARDLARLARILYRDHRDLYRYFSARAFTYAGRTFKSHNRFLDLYPGSDGLKTGYIRASGYNLAASAERDGRRLIAIVTGGESARDRDRHMAGLLDLAFAASDSAGDSIHLARGGVEDGVWAVQVGAFYRPADARRAMDQALAGLPSHSAQAEATRLVPVEGRRGLLYRARLVGLTRERARTVCAVLETQGVPCFSLRFVPGT